MRKLYFKKILAIIQIICMFNLYTVVMAEENYVNDKVEDFAYVIQSDGTVRITEYLGKGGTVIFPSEIEGYPVTIIGDGNGWGVHFEKTGAEDPVKKIIIPEGIKKIEDSAFSGFNNA